MRIIGIERDLLAKTDRFTAANRRRFADAGVFALNLVSSPGSGKTSLLVRTIDDLLLERSGLLFIENVGNLVCPAAFDLGEAHKVVVLSVTEGEDRPLKYPDMFAAADLMLLNKSDLLPHLDLDMAACLAAARHANPQIEILQVSARTGDGLAAFYDWIEGSLPY